MRHVFMAGPERVVWKRMALGPNGPHRLTVRDAADVIVEYSSTATAAFQRELHLEQWWITARGGVLWKVTSP